MLAFKSVETLELELRRIGHVELGRHLVGVHLQRAGEKIDYVHHASECFLVPQQIGKLVHDLLEQIVGQGTQLLVDVIELDQYELNHRVEFVVARVRLGLTAHHVQVDEEILFGHAEYAKPNARFVFLDCRVFEVLKYLLV